MSSGLIVVGALVLLAGAVFAGQGLGYIKGSFMTGDIHWFLIGSGMVIGGALLAAIGFLAGRRRQSRV